MRPGGVVAFVTSRFTMDSQNSDARRFIAQRAELLGAIRLPNNAFKANAGTEVVSDIIFLQKRDHPIDIEPDWVSFGYYAGWLYFEQLLRRASGDDSRGAFVGEHTIWQG